MTEHSKTAWAASDAEGSDSKPDVPPAFLGTKWRKQPKSRTLFLQHHQHFLGKPFTRKVVILPRILRTAICFCLGRETYKGCIQSYILKKNSSLIGTWKSRHFKEGKKEWGKGGTILLFFQTYFKPQENPTVIRTSVNTVDSSENCSCSSGDFPEEPFTATWRVVSSSLFLEASGHSWSLSLP